MSALAALEIARALLPVPRLGRIASLYRPDATLHYFGYRDLAGTCSVLRFRRTDGWRPLPVGYPDIATHSPTGFGWGYSGSGPMQLAAVLLHDAAGRQAEDTIPGLYQHLCRYFVGLIRGDRWDLPADDLLGWVAEVRLEVEFGDGLRAEARAR